MIGSKLFILVEEDQEFSSSDEENSENVKL